MPQLHKITALLGGIRAHRRLIAVWFGSFSALATALAVGAFATSGSTLDAGSATPPHPLDLSHPCTWYVLPNVSDASRTLLEVGATPPPSSDSAEDVAEVVEKAEQLRSNIEAAADPEVQTLEQQILTTGLETLSNPPSGNASPSLTPPPAPTPTNPVPTPNADPIVNAPPAINPYTGTVS